MVKSLFGLANSECQRGKKGEAKEQGVGPNPTDKGKPGTKRHLVVCRRGIPLAMKCTGANVADTTMLEEMVDAIPPIKRGKRGRGRPRKRPVKLHADKGYDSKSNREALRKRGIIPRIARRGVDSSEKLGRRTVGLWSAPSHGSTASADWLFVMSDGWTFTRLFFNLAVLSSAGATLKRRFVRYS